MIYFRANQEVHKLDSTLSESIHHAYVTAWWYSYKINNQNINL